MGIGVGDEMKMSYFPLCQRDTGSVQYKSGYFPLGRESPQEVLPAIFRVIGREGMGCRM